MRSSIRAVAIWLLLGVLGAAGSFVVTTLLANELPDTVVAGCSALGGGILAAVLWGKRVFGGAQTWRRPGSEMAAAGGMLAFYVAPLVALSQRATDAPTGTEAAFFTTASWGLAVIITVLAVRYARSSAAAVVTAAASVVGSAVLLASWERPSSFSPLVRFLPQEVMMLVAGIIFGVGAVLIHKAAERSDWRFAGVWAAAGAAILACGAAVPGLFASAPSALRLSSSLATQGFFGALFIVGWIGLSGAVGPARTSVIWLSVPSVLTTLSLLERLTGVHGPDPIRWAPAGAGIAVALICAVATWGVLGKRPSEGREDESTGLRRIARGVAVLLAGAGVSSLALESIRGEVTGSLGDGFHAIWALPGLETASGWVACAAAVLAAAAFLAARNRTVAPTRWLALASGVCVAAYPYVLDTPLRTWTSWIPPEVQQVYGTEYARLTFTPLHAYARMVLLVIAMAVAVVALEVSRRTAAEVKVRAEGQ